MSKKKQPHKTRNTWAYFQFSHDVNEIQVRVEGDDVKVLGADTQYTKTVRSYERQSGKDKVELSIPSQDGKASFSPDNQLVNQFKWLIAVDTNYIDLNGDIYAVTVIYITTKELGPSVTEVPFDHLETYLIKSPRQGINPELIGWHLALQHIQQPPCGSQIGMIVDSEAGKLAAFNSRSEPYLDGLYLPSYVSLIYASADQGHKLANQMIKYCDKVGEQVVRKLRAEGSFDFGSSGSENSLYQNLVKLIPRKKPKGA
ncbi:hypothetical protein [Halomonas citrativorans]|uniref:Uncharacterized protein n=1 Tax=Halomonas citrativorans TaxID=2742612 RepID=A0ABR9F996_9GAMM|nr:hypothetical protein [Halomonas citrativorans]MBE0403053.1 hypothetical protein [Halomonas citrativorans]